MTNGIEAALAALSGDPALTGSVGADAAMVIWSASLDRVLWASRPAEGFRTAIEGPDGRPNLPGTVLDRMRDLGGGLAPRTGMRLARLRFGPEGSSPSTVACRLVAVDGADALLTIFMSGVPHLVGPAGAQPDAPASAEPLPALASRRGGVLRFTWSMDRETRFRSVSAALGEVVGATSADILGRAWSELVGRIVIDPHGTIAAHLASRSTWSDERIFWRVGTEGDQVVPVELGGMPIFGRAHEFDGFRGFGFCMADDVQAADAMELGTGAVESPARQVASGADRESSTVEDDASYGALRSRVGAQLGAGRPFPLRTAPEPEAPREAATSARRPALSLSERGALREIARALGRAGLETGPDSGDQDADDATRETEPPSLPDFGADAERILHRLPVGLLVLRGEDPVYANRCCLDLLGYADLPDLVAAGGGARLFAGRAGTPKPDSASAPVALVTRSGGLRSAEIRLTTVEWAGAPASLLLLRPLQETDEGATPASLRLEIEGRERRLRDLRGLIDLAGLAAATIDRAGRILSLTEPAESLFGFAANEIVGEAWTILLAADSHPEAVRLLGTLGAGTAEAALVGKQRGGGRLPLAVRLGRRGGSDGAIAVSFRDLTSERAAETELAAARRAAETAEARQSDVLARVSHEIRTPLNAIIGFAEIMLEERFGSIGNERYKVYLKDIHGSGEHVLSLVNDLLDLAKIAAGRAELSLTSLDLNEVVGGSVGLMQPSAARERIIMRTRLAPSLPAVIADERSVRQIALNLVSNAIRYTEAGGQVIVSTGLTDAGDVVFRVRDTGIGMAPDEIEHAMEPFRQISLARRNGGTGLGLPLAKALTEANRGLFTITSRAREGTLVEILFPRSRVLAE